MKYKKKPVVIDAIQFIDDDYGTLCAIGNLGLKPELVHNPTRLEIATLEGTMRADIGDYIIKGVQGEFYPCKPDIFEQTYENVNEEESKTNFDVVTESVENLARFLINRYISCDVCGYKDNRVICMEGKCIDGIKEYLNQKVESEV